MVLIGEMVQAYNFLASWQLFPEKGNYESGQRPLSGSYKIAAVETEKKLTIEHHWVSLEHHAFHSEYTLQTQSGRQPFSETTFAEESELLFPDGINLAVHFYKEGALTLEIVHEILPNGYLKVTQKGLTVENKPFTNVEVYHKQLSVLPYAAAVSGALIRPTEEGVIRHKALTAMEEQTNMQLEQIRKQIELLALQAQEIQKRKELSLIIYDAQLNFTPVIGHTYHLYERKDGTTLLSMVSPKEWGGGSGPYQKYLAAVQLLADHTWVEVA
jgi:hypothetical protein